MLRFPGLFLIFLPLLAQPALADDRLSVGEMRKAVLGSWSGNWKGSSFAVSISADGTVTGRYAGIPAHGSWTARRMHGGDKFCLTVSAAVLSDTKCGELFRRGNSVIYGYLNHGKPRLWLKRD